MTEQFTPNHDPLWEQVRTFVHDEIGLLWHEIRPDTSFYHDCGIDGDDGENLLIAFQQKFDVDMSSLQCDLHFGPELCLFNPLILFLPDTWRLMKEPRNERGQVLMVPITVQDLYTAAKTKRWPDLRNRPRR